MKGEAVTLAFFLLTTESHQLAQVLINKWLATLVLFSVSSYAVSVELATASGLMSREMTAEAATSHPSRRQRRGGNKRGSGRWK